MILFHIKFDLNKLTRKRENGNMVSNLLRYAPRLTYAVIFSACACLKAETAQTGLQFFYNVAFQIIKKKMREYGQRWIHNKLLIMTLGVKQMNREEVITVVAMC